jgi:hypothetical protein
MTLKRDNRTTGNAFAGLIDNSAAEQAASRLYQDHDIGMRFCCDSGERISPEEARIRDARDAARRGHAKPEESLADYSEVEEFARSSAIAEEDFDPVMESDPDEDYEIDLGDLDIGDTEDETFGMLELELID